MGAFVLPICVAVVAGYLLGSISFGLVFARLRRVDLRSVGSGNIGATNVARALGKRWGVLVMALDAAKAVVPILVARAYFARQPLDAEARAWLEVMVAAAAFLGHLYPVFHRFQGGKGVATAFGAFVALAPKAAGLGFLTYALAYGVSRISSVGSLSAVLLFPLWLYLTGAPSPCYWLSGGLLLFILITHRGNIARLLSRQEQKV